MMGRSTTQAKRRCFGTVKEPCSATTNPSSSARTVMSGRPTSRSDGPSPLYGQTDDIGHKVTIDRVSINDLHATTLHLLGIDHKRLTYRYSGRDFRLTDVAGRVVTEIVVYPARLKWDSRP